MDPPFDRTDPMAPDRPLPTDAELEILRVLWDRGPSTVRAVLEGLDDDRGYTTVLKLLQIMHGKRLVRRRRAGRSHVYEAGVDREPTQRALVSDLAERAFDGSATSLVLRALSTRRATDAELADVRRMVERLEEEGR